MAGLPEIEQAKFYQSSKLNDYVYYATDNKIYNYAYATTGNGTVDFEAPAGETITCMKLYRPQPNTSLLDKEDRVLYVATWNGTTGKVYELGLNATSGKLNTTPLNVFEIDGKVADMCPRVKE